MLDRTAILADADRRAASMRHLRAEAERDLARRRRLMERVRAVVVYDIRARVLAPSPYLPATLSPADARRFDPIV